MKILLLMTTLQSERESERAREREREENFGRKKRKSGR